MERRINEHIVSFHFPAVPDHCAAAAAGSSDFPGSGGGSLAAQSNQAAEMAAAEMSAIRSSFGHRVPAAADVFDTTAAAVPGRRHIVNSESFHSVVGITGIGTQGTNSIENKLAWSFSLEGGLSFRLRLSTLEKGQKE